jgi:hypothetical protein
MIILCTAFGSLEEYLPVSGEAKLEPPSTCARCGRSSSFVGHGGYWRRVIEGQRVAQVKVPRFRCRDCTLVVSILFGFLLPYRRFSVRAVAAGLDGYATEEGSYRHRAYELSCLLPEQPEQTDELTADDDVPVRPAGSQIFRWVNAVASAAERLLQQLQKELLLNGKPVEPLATECPNATRAHSAGKQVALNRLAVALSFGRRLVAAEVEVARRLHAYFLSAAESCPIFLMGIVQPDKKTQSLHRVIF